MNVVEKILAARSGKAKVEPDDVVITGVDVMVMHDLSANFVMKVFENEMSGARIANPDKIDSDAYGQRVTVTGKTDADTITVATLQM